MQNELPFIATKVKMIYIMLKLEDCVCVLMVLRDPRFFTLDTIVHSPQIMAPLKVETTSTLIRDAFFFYRPKRKVEQSVLVKTKIAWNRQRI